MKIFYSTGTGGFYADEIHEKNIPDDSIEIGVQLHEQLMEGQSFGKIIMPPDEDHPMPWLAAPPPASLESVKEGKQADIHQGFDTALQNIFSLPEQNNTPTMLAVEAARLAAEDNEGFLYILEKLENYRNSLLQQVDKATTKKAVREVIIAYPV